MSQDPTTPEPASSSWQRVLPGEAPRTISEPAHPVREVSSRRIRSYFDHLAGLLRTTQVSDAQGRSLTLESAFSWVARRARKTHDEGGKLLFVGNGGSAAIASHMAIDWSKNGQVRALALNDPAALTCLGNDLGYENVFARQVEMHAREGDMLVAISSSGRSESILRAVEVARGRRCPVVTFSGFSPGNALRRRGHLNLWVESAFYGHVEIAHLALCHAILDLSSSPRSRA